MKCPEILDFAVRVRNALRNKELDPYTGIHYLKGLRERLLELPAEEKVEILSLATCLASIDRRVSQYDANQNQPLNFETFVLAHLNILIEEFLLIQINCQPCEQV